MALTAYKIIEADTAAALTTAVTAEISGGNGPIGPPTVQLRQGWPVAVRYAQAIGIGVTTVTNYEVVAKATAAEMKTVLDARIGASWIMLGGVIAVPKGDDLRFFGMYAQAIYKGTPAGAVAAHVHSGADITSGTVPVAQLPLANGATKGIVGQGTGNTIAAGVINVP